MGTPQLNPEMPSKASLSGSSAIAHLPPHHFPAVAVVPPAVVVVGQRVCATAPVAEADYSLQKSNGAAGERYVGGGRGGGAGEVGGTAAPQLQLLCVGGDERRAGSDERRTALQRGG